MDTGNAPESVGEGAQDAERTIIPGDTPIADAAGDLLGRQTTAEVLAAEIRLVDASEGYVVGILGPWGSGKTSLVNLVKAELAKDPAVPTLDFNPWLFSGADQLVESFFRELAAQLRLRKDRLANVADDVDAYAEVVAPLRYLPVVGPWIERIRGGAKALKTLSDRRRGGVGTARTKLVTALQDLEQPIVVVLDDIDRLRTDEIRDVFKLVRLTANFPNMIYVVVFDRKRVEQALGEDGLPGRDYLEKILQLAYDVPAFPEHVLTSAMTKELDRVLEHVQPTGPWQQERWPDVFAEIVRPLVTNMRDVRRYVAAVHATATGVGEHVAIVDVLGLEAVRVFLPDVFDGVVHAQAGLTTPFNWAGHGSEPPGPGDGVRAIIGLADKHADVARSVIKRLFPAGQRHIENNSYGPEWLKTWLRDRRVAHPDILSFYLERVAGSGLRAFLHAEQAFALLGNPDELNELLDSLSEGDTAQVIERLEVFEGEYPPDVVEPAIVVLLNRMPMLDDDDAGSRYMFGTRFVVTRVVLRMLQSCADEASREQVVRSALPQLTSLTSKRELLRIVGYEHESGHELIPRDSVAELDAQLRAQVRAATAGELAREAELLRLLLWLRRTSLPAEPEYRLPFGDGLEVALLLDSTTTRRVQSMDSRAVSTSERLVWEALVDAVGGQDQIAAFLDRARAENEASDSRARSLLELADRYASGWRPDDV